MLVGANMGRGGVVCCASGSLQAFPDVDLVAVLVIAARLGLVAGDVEGLHDIAQLPQYIME